MQLLSLPRWRISPQMIHANRHVPRCLLKTIHSQLLCVFRLTKYTGIMIDLLYQLKASPCSVCVTPGRLSSEVSDAVFTISFFILNSSIPLLKKPKLLSLLIIRSPVQIPISSWSVEESHPNASIRDSFNLFAEINIIHNQCCLELRMMF